MAGAGQDDAAAQAPIDQAFLDALARLGETRNWEVGSVVVTEGEPGDAMYIVHAGQLRAVVGSASGRGVELNTLGPGEYFGELTLGGQRRSATVEAITPARLTRVTHDNVLQLLKSRPELGLLLIQRLVERVRTLTRTVGNLGSQDVYQRLAGLLDAAAVVENDRPCIHGMSQQRIAERLGASRAMVNRLLGDLARGGYIEMARGRIVLLQRLPPRW